jgi:hypothetical protein
MARWRTTCFAVLFLHAIAAPALAEPAAPRSDAEVEARLAWIERALDREQASGRLWYDSWVGLFGAATLAQAGIALNVNDPAARVSGIVGSVKSGIACGFMLLNPATARTAADTIRAMRADTPAERAAKLLRAETLLRTIATEQRFGRSWFPRVGGAALNTAAAWITWATTRGTAVGWIGLLSGVAVAQLNIHTQPTSAIAAWESYSRAGSALPRLDPAPPPRVSVVPMGAGLALHTTF